MIDMMGVIIGKRLRSLISHSTDDTTPKLKLYGYIYDGMVLSKPEWDTEKYSNAIMSHGDGAVSLYVSSVPFSASEDGAIVSAPYGVYQYDRATDTWTTFAEVSEGDPKTVGSDYLMWSNQTVTKLDGGTLIKRTTPKTFYINDPNTPTAFLNAHGDMIFQKNSVRSEDFYAAFVGWDTSKYTSYYKVPWLRIDGESIDRMTLDTIPAHTDYWFYGCENLGYAYLPEGLIKIGARMFYGTKLHEFVFPSTIEEIGASAYANLVSTGSLTYDRLSINIPDSVKKIGDSAFYKAKGIEWPHCHVTIGDGCEEIGSHAFAENGNIFSVVIGESVKRICPYAFYRIGTNRAGVSTISDSGPSVTFKNPDGWWVSTDANATGGISVDVNGGKIAAQAIASYTHGGIWNVTQKDGTYVDYYWNRSYTENKIDDMVIERYPDAAGADKMFLMDENGNLTRGYLYNTSDNPFTITYYDSESTEFKAKGWLRVAYHTTGEYAGQITIDDFVTTESEGWNYIKNIQDCTRDALYYNGVKIWPIETEEPDPPVDPDDPDTPVDPDDPDDPDTPVDPDDPVDPVVPGADWPDDLPIDEDEADGAVDGLLPEGDTVDNKADKFVLESDDGNVTIAYMMGDAFTITSYDYTTTEFKAIGWIRLSYHTTGEYAGKFTLDDFRTVESGGWNYLKNIRYCSRAALYYNGDQIWPKYRLGRLALKNQTIRDKFPTTYSHTNTWAQKTWKVNNSRSFMPYAYTWSDGTNIYYGNFEDQFVLNGDTWETKKWNIEIHGDSVWTDGTNIYHSYNSGNHVLIDGKWVKKTWNNAPDNLWPGYLWSDGTNIYYANSGDYRVLNGDTWEQKTWNNAPGYVVAGSIWSDGKNIFHTRNSITHVLNGDTWQVKEFGGDAISTGEGIWFVGTNLYYSTYQTQCALIDGAWEPIVWNTESGESLSGIRGSEVWSDGVGIYWKGSSVLV